MKKIKKFIINGKEYTEDTLPTQFKKILQDADGDGKPDIFDGIDPTVTTTTTNKISINGKTYTDWKDVPSEFQHLEPGSNSTPQAKPAPMSLQTNKHHNLYLVIAFLLVLVAYLAFQVMKA